MGRTPTKVVVSAQTVIELSKSTLVCTIRCDALVPIRVEDGTGKRAQCNQEIGSWKLFFKHQLKHCHVTKHKGKKVYECRLSRCSAKLHESAEALKKHIESSHMKQPFPCPFANCRPPIPEYGRAMSSVNMFLRKQDLVGHLQLNHSDLLGSELDLRSERLLPSWEPRPPMRPLPAPPDLPSTVLSVSLRMIVDPPPIIPSGWFAHVDVNGASSSRFAPPPTQAPTPWLFPLGTPKTPIGRTPDGRRGLLSRTSSLIMRSSSPEHDDPQYDFSDIAPAHYSDAIRGMDPEEVMRAPYFFVQHVEEDLSMWPDMVRAPPLRQFPVLEAPPPRTSIFHEALKQQVFAQYAQGQDHTAASAPD
ncbi:hypothetical protein C8F04DRAFT_1068814 [Mycena alexandri]|uniref:C2H2-type domain-containing protein n=1 Tax=Mycena alexandri TaxID=1745969 RepID=A0AAD6TDI6_9AGAR|nr:hypothetical protein C8F04DRAFT_1068814 [Mycena alexandri]